MPYQQIRFIAYTIGTMPRVDASGNASYPGLTTGSPPATSPEDIDARCALMLRAMRTAASQLAAASPDILNVFMAPEFFFRGPMGAYDMDECQRVIAQLQETVATAEWSGWLFVFGSIVGASAPASPSGGAAPDEAYNFTLIQLGGPGNTGGVGANMVMKELQAGCDFIDTAQDPTSALVGNVAYLDAGPSGPGREQQQLAYDGAGVFTQCGMTWGLEICLDHYDNIAQTGRLQRAPQLPGEQQLQFQLVPSCGMSIHDAQIMAMPGGYVFNCDGAGVPSATLKRVNATGAPAVVTPAASVPVSALPLDGGGSPPAQVAIDALTVAGPGQVVLYAPVAVPAPATVPGSARDIVWQATDTTTITFRLVFDGNGAFVTALCLIDTDLLNTGGRAYFLPLLLQTTVAPFGHAVEFDVSLGPGALGYTHGIHCTIVSPQLDFEGYAVLFDDAGASAKPDMTCW